jgi:hypothetical protein
MLDFVVAVALTWRGWMAVAGIVLLAVVAVLWLIARRQP